VIKAILFAFSLSEMLYKDNLRPALIYVRIAESLLIYYFKENKGIMIAKIIVVKIYVEFHDKLLCWTITGTG